MRRKGVDPESRGKTHLAHKRNPDLPQPAVSFLFPYPHATPESAPVPQPLSTSESEAHAHADADSYARVKSSEQEKKLTLTPPYERLEETDQHVFPDFPLEVCIRGQRPECIVLDCETGRFMGVRVRSDRGVSFRSGIGRGTHGRGTGGLTFRAHARRTFIYQPEIV